MDDTHTMFVSLSWRSSPPSIRPLNNARMVPGSRPAFEYLPNTTDWYGRWRLAQNPSNNWMIDRAAQKSGEIFTGIASIHGQDQAVTESMGGITDHGSENLRPSDLMLARAFNNDGTVPPGVDDPDIYFEVRSGDFLADAKIAWRDAYNAQMRAAIRPLRQAAE